MVRFIMTKKVLIIGGGGFIGSNILKFLVENREYAIDIVDNFSRSSSKMKILKDKYHSIKELNIINADLTLSSSFDQLQNDYDYVYMLAAVVGVDKVNAIPHEVIRINSLLTLNVLEWLKVSKCKRVLFSSTSEAYAGSVEVFNFKVPTPENVPLTIEDIGHPRFSYAVTKMLGESGFLNYSKQGYFESVIIRYHNVYGPEMGFRHVLPHLVERFNSNENPFLVYGHDQTRSFNHIDDAVHGTVLAIEKGKNGEIYHIGDQDEISINDLTKYVGEIMDFDGTYENAPTFPGSVSRRCPDITKAKKHLDYLPKVHWKDGVKDCVDWYIERINSSEEHQESFYDQYGIKK